MFRDNLPVRNFHNIPKERTSHLLRGGSLKSRHVCLFARQYGRGHTIVTSREDSVSPAYDVITKRQTPALCILPICAERQLTVLYFNVTYAHPGQNLL
jgi:hypothetical protein